MAGLHTQHKLSEAETDGTGRQIVKNPLLRQVFSGSSGRCGDDNRAMNFC